MYRILSGTGLEGVWQVLNGLAVSGFLGFWIF